MNQIAETIVEQCGGTNMMRMIGVTSIVHGENSATVKFSCKALYGINCFEVTLDPSDTYTVKFWVLNKLNIKLHYEVSDIYSDQLIDLLETKLGLILRMQRVRRKGAL